jgi:arylsulfatase A-like enzyme
LDAVNSRRIRPTAAEVARYEQLYDGNLAVADQELGWLRARLEAAGLWDRSLVIVAADHGEALHEHGFIGHNAQLYEESVRIPLVVRFPRGTFPRGARVPAAVDLLDVAPTVADAFGLRGRAVASFRGRSLFDVLAGGGPRGELLARSAGPRPLYALTGEDTKYVFNSRYGGEELYDLRSDPGEQRDVAAAQPLVASVYRQRMYRLLLDLPGRWTGAPAAWRLPAEEREELRALGYVH